MRKRQIWSWYVWVALYLPPQLGYREQVKFYYITVLSFGNHPICIFFSFFVEYFAVDTYTPIPISNNPTSVETRSSSLLLRWRHRLQKLCKSWFLKGKKSQKSTFIKSMVDLLMMLFHTWRFQPLILASLCLLQTQQQTSFRNLNRLSALGVAFRSENQRNYLL